MATKESKENMKRIVVLFMVLVMCCFGTMGFGYIAYLFYLTSLLPS